MVLDLLTITPIGEFDSVLDAGSGKNKVWFNTINQSEKYECEIENGCDFLQLNKEVDWIVGNPPYHISWKFTEKAIQFSKKGFAWLTNNQGLNSLFTPKRQKIIKEFGFYLQKIHIVQDKRWFGRYYYLIFTKTPNNFLSWKDKTY